MTPGRLVLLGSPVAHSLSPVIQDAALRAAGLALRYEALDVPATGLAGILTMLRDVGGAGNVTVPHKVAVAAACDACTPVALQAGAVNTFRFDGGRLVGTNTDVGGFDAAAGALGVPREGARVLCLGAGGAARAVCVAVGGWPGATVDLWSRREAQALSAARDFPHAGCVVAPRLAYTLVVNATPLGLRDEDAWPMPVAELPPDAYVMDLVYRSGATPWVQACRASGHRAIDGLEMLLHQAALAFAWWFGMAPDITAMRRAVGL